MKQKSLEIELVNILNLEHSALINGQLDKFDEIIERKEYLLNSILSHPLEASLSLDKIKEKIFTNQSLILSAQKGVTLAQEKLREIERCNNEMDIYAENGKKNRLDVRILHKLEKRA